MLYNHSLLEVFFISLNLNLDQFKDVFHVIKVALLRPKLLFKVLNSLTVFLVKILEGIDQVDILECDQGFLEDAEVEHLDLLDCVLGCFIRECLQHQHDINVLVHRGLGHDSKLAQEQVDLADSLFGDFEVRHVHIIAPLLLRVLLMHD